MAKTMQRTKRPTKRERKRAAAEGRALVRKRHSQRRTLAYVLGAFAAIAVVVLGLIALMGSEGDRDTASILPSRLGEVTVSGPARAEPLGRGEAVPSFTAPGFQVPGAKTGDPTVSRQNVSWSLGEPTVVSIWAPWCPHCQVELPVLARVARANPDVTFLTIVTSIGTSPEPDPGAFMAGRGCRRSRR